MEKKKGKLQVSDVKYLAQGHCRNPKIENLKKKSWIL